MNTAPTLNSLLARGLLPKELPRCIQTVDFAKFASTQLHQIRAEFGNKWTRSARYNLVRPGGTRRTLSIPNPFAYAILSETLLEDWPQISTVLGKSTLSRSTPITLSGSGEFARSIVPSCAVRDLFASRLEFRAEAGYLLRADVLDFYGSIYTHSIPWAILGKADAKKLLGKAHKDEWANRIDSCFRNMHDGQTVGIDVGPDVSFVVAEAILSAIDATLVDRIKDVRGFRYYDDYELYFDDRGSAEAALAVLQDTLLEYELILNQKKTEVVSLPQPIDYGWALELRQSVGRLGERRRQKDELVGLFEHAFRLIKAGVHEHVLRYVIGLTQEFDFLPSVWPIYEKLLWQAAQIEPAVLRSIILEVLKYKKGRLNADDEYEVDSALAGRVLNGHISRSLRQSSTHEVAWAIWGLIALEQDVQPAVSAACSASSDPTVALMLLLAREKGRSNNGYSLDGWQAALRSEALLEPMWLFAYEAGRRNLKIGPTDVVGNSWLGERYSNLFATMRAADVSFTADQFDYAEENADEDYDYSVGSDEDDDREDQDDDDEYEDRD